MIRRKLIPANIIKTDKFQMMPLSTKWLFLEMLVNSDDAGIVSNSCSVLNEAGASPVDLKLLIAKGFVQVVDGGFYVVSEEVYFS